MMLSLYSIIVMIVLFLFLTITTPTLQAQQLYSEILSKYFQGNTQPQLFVSVGLIEELTEAMQNHFRNWQSLYMLEEKSIAVHPYYASEKTTLIYGSTNNQTKEAVLQMSLGQLCTKYYVKTPKILIISAREDFLSFLQSNVWSDQLCSPVVLLLQSQDERVKNYLRGIGYTIQGKDQNLLEFTFNSQVEDALQIQEAQHAIPPFISVGQLLKIGEEYIGKKAIFVHTMSDNYLLAEDIINSLPQQGQYAHIFITNFNTETDSVIIGHFYLLEFVDFDGHYFIKIEVYNDRGGMAYLYLYLSEKQNAQLKIIGPEDQRLCRLKFPEKIKIQENRTIETLLQKPIEVVQEDKKPEPIKQEDKVQQPTIPEQNSTFAWLITISLILLFSIALRSLLTKSRQPIIIKHHYNTIRTHQISIIQEELQPLPK